MPTLTFKVENIFCLTNQRSFHTCYYSKQADVIFSNQKLQLEASLRICITNIMHDMEILCNKMASYPCN
jgi:hypothetical protein